MAHGQPMKSPAPGRFSPVRSEGGPQPTATSRRVFLQSAWSLGVALGLTAAPAALQAQAAHADDRPWEDGELLGHLDFQAEPAAEAGRRIYEGLDTRLYTDLSRVRADRLLTPVEEFYIRTGIPDRLDRSRPWQIRIGGLVDRPAVLTMADLEARTAPMGPHLMECAGNNRAFRFGLMSAAEWSGVNVSELLAEHPRAPEATSVLIEGFDDYSSSSTTSTQGSAWIFRLDQLEEAGAFLATRMNGEGLTPDHGFPVRLMVPGWYGCCCIKWVNRIELVDENWAATSQMTEFALRTHQGGVPEKAAAFQPAIVDRAAMPIRIEKWRVGGALRYRVIGIDWGGDRARAGLRIRFRPGQPWQPVEIQPAADVPSTHWALWSHRWSPTSPGRYLLQLDVDDPGIQTRRLDLAYYARGIELADTEGV